MVEEPIKQTKVFAELKKWDGEKEEIEIKREWIDDIVTAVQAQCMIANKQTGLCINGGQYYHVDIYEVEI